MPKIFRTSPPIELIEKALLCFGLRGVQDATWFSKSCIHLANFEEFLPEIEPYYIPCKAKEYIHINPSPITILRHLLTSHGAKLESQEKTTNGVKSMWYRIFNENKLISDTIIEFN